MVYVTETGGASGELSVVDLLSGQVSQVVGGLSGPQGLWVTASGTTAYVAELGTGDLLKIDTATGVTTTVVGGFTTIEDVAVDAPEAFAWVTVPRR